MAITSPENIGGGYVRRWCDLGRPGDVVSRETLLAIPDANRDAMISVGFIEVFPPLPADAGHSRYIVGVPGPGAKCRVFEGRELTTHPISRDEAEELATRPQ